MTEAEKLAEEYAQNNIGFQKLTREAFLAGYEAGIGRLRYCCTCRHYLTCLGKDEETALYGICGNWEIKE